MEHALLARRARWYCGTLGALTLALGGCFMEGYDAYLRDATAAPPPPRGVDMRPDPRADLDGSADESERDGGSDSDGPPAGDADVPVGGEGGVPPLVVEAGAEDAGLDARVDSGVTTAMDGQLPEASLDAAPEAGPPDAAPEAGPPDAAPSTDADAQDDASTLLATCERQGTCSPRCSSGQSCALSCADAGVCNASCAAGTTCTVRCEQASTCNVRCEGSSTCRVECRDNDSCPVQCEEDTGVCRKYCNSGAICTMPSCVGGSFTCTTPIPQFSCHAPCAP